MTTALLSREPLPTLTPFTSLSPVLVTRSRPEGQPPPSQPHSDARREVGEVARGSPARGGFLWSLLGAVCGLLAHRSTPPHSGKRAWRPPLQDDTADVTTQPKGGRKGTTAWGQD